MIAEKSWTAAAAADMCVCVQNTVPNAHIWLDDLSEI